MGARKRLSRLKPGLKLGFLAPVADFGSSEEANHYFLCLLGIWPAQQKTNAQGGGLT